MTRAVTSASNIHRRALCPGSEKLEAGLPDEESDLSRQGDLLHQYAANPSLDRSFLKPMERDLLTISDRLDQVVIERVVEQFKIEPDAECHTGFEKVLVALKGTEAETPGHADFYKHFPQEKLLLITDRKTGFKEVSPAAANPQLRVYAIAGASEFDCEHVVVAITQPRLSYSRRVTLAAYTVDDIRAASDELIAIRKASREPNAPLIPSEEACRYCRARAVCPALREKLGSDLALVKLEKGTLAKRSADAEELVKRCTDEQLDKLLVAIQLADFVKDFARDEGRRRVAAGQLEGWKLGKETEVRTVEDPRRAFSLLTLKGVLPKEDIFDCAKLSITKIEEKVREKTGCSWKEAKKIIFDAIGSVIETDTRKAGLSRK